MAQPKAQRPKQRATGSSNGRSKTAPSATSKSARSGGSARASTAKNGAPSSRRASSTAKRSSRRSPAQTQASRRNDRKRVSSKSAPQKAQAAVTDQARNVESSARSAGKSVGSAVSSAGKTAGKVASKAKGPALASGAAAIGLAGGMLMARSNSKPGLTRLVPSPRTSSLKTVGRGLLDATENVGKASGRLAELTQEVRLVRESIEQNGKRRSPIEVVLQGLTRRGG